jgi:alanyl-tRNA synthetase
MQRYDNLIVKEGDIIGLVFKETPFFPRRGGQESDKGTIRVNNIMLDVHDVIEPVEGLIVHWGIVHLLNINKKEGL